jgi:hypothetical protein
MVIRANTSPDGEQRVITNSDEFAASQVTVGTTATLLSAANPNRKFLSLTNTDASVSVFIGGSGVTTANGHGIPANTTLTFQGAITTAAVYGIVAASTEVVTVLEY